MKLFVLIFCLALNALAHDEGHGPAVKDGGLYGGILASVMKEADLKGNHHAKATVHYKAELIRAQDGTLTLYFHTPDMKKHDLAGFDNEITVKMEVKKAGKYAYVGEFKLTKKDHLYSGKLPTVRTRPFNLDMFPVVNKEKLFIGFSNLD
jgi:polynucleotide 5'-kinase involved in rRNA processing